MKDVTIAHLLRLLKIARARRASTQQRIADQLGVKQGYLSDLEKGRHDPRLSTFLQWSRLLGFELMLIPKEFVLTVNEILGEEASTDLEFSQFKPLPDEV